MVDGRVSLQSPGSYFHNETESVIAYLLIQAILHREVNSSHCRYRTIRAQFSSNPLSIHYAAYCERSELEPRALECQKSYGLAEMGNGSLINI